MVNPAENSQEGGLGANRLRLSPTIIALATLGTDGLGTSGLAPRCREAGAALSSTRYQPTKLGPYDAFTAKLHRGWGGVCVHDQGQDL